MTHKLIALAEELTARGFPDEDSLHWFILAPLAIGDDDPVAFNKREGPPARVWPARRRRLRTERLSIPGYSWIK